MSTPPTYDEITAIANRTNAATARSGLPGWINGPADALRHLIVAGEFRRIYGPAIARVYLDGNEVRAAIFDKNATRAGTMMDHWNNSEGMDLGKDAASFDEVVERAEVDAILARPPESWSEAETRKAMDDPRYWKRQDARIAALVERSFRHRHPGTTDGPVEVDACTRDDGTHVAGHTRAAPRGRAG